MIHRNRASGKKLLNGTNVDCRRTTTDNDRHDRRQHTHNIIRLQNFCGSIKIKVHKCCKAWFSITCIT